MALADDPLPDEGDDPLDSATIEELHAELDDRWTVVDDHHLVATYEFDDFADALAFTNAVGDLAEEVFHHPEITLAWGRVGIELYTHDVDGLQRTDFVVAARMDRRYERMD
ncbi:pterin-4-alpha-carbinolamine dehydratase [Halobacteriales archaeon SW_7_68_16]|nr:MAG: pterin-4-alpha-carbinolamine dehydratase [Halobacteriales archaeon SW_7_68_16]